MPDMLVKLYDLPPLHAIDGVTVRRARPYEITRVAEFVTAHFAQSWADEISVGFANKPTSVWIAIDAGEVIGFAAAECTCRGFFGPTGVAPGERGRGVGRALLLAALHGLREIGYAYAIIGGVGPADFYARAVGATLIEGSTPGIYGDALKKRG